MSFSRLQEQMRKPSLGLSFSHRFSMLGLVLALGIIWAGFLLLYLYPLYEKADQFEAEREALQAAQKAEQLELTPFTLVQDIPSLEQLPAVIEGCRNIFQEEGIEVSSLNVERILPDASGQTSQGAVAAPTSQNGAPVAAQTLAQGGASPTAVLDFALTRLRWKGSWSGIERGLARLEEHPTYRIRVYEVSLKPGGGDGALEIYFRTSGQ